MGTFYISIIFLGKGFSVVIKLGRIILGYQQPILSWCDAFYFAEDLCEIALIGEPNLIANLCQTEIGICQKFFGFVYPYRIKVGAKVGIHFFVEYAA